MQLSTRYITDRFLPDKAIDVLDEVGARVHLKNIHVPENITQLEQEIENVKEEKTVTTIKQLNEEETINEIARIATGEVTEISKQHAIELRKAS